MLLMKLILRNIYFGVGNVRNRALPKISMCLGSVFHVPYFSKCKNALLNSVRLYLT